MTARGHIEVRKLLVRQARERVVFEDHRVTSGYRQGNGGRVGELEEKRKDKGRKRERGRGVSSDYGAPQGGALNGKFIKFGC